MRARALSLGFFMGLSMELRDMTDEEQHRVEAITGQLRGLGLTEEQIERHVSPLTREKPEPRKLPRGRTTCIVSRFNTGCRKAPVFFS